MRDLTVKELVIEVEQQIQRLASHRRDGIKRGQIIWALNRAQDQIVRDSLKPNPNNPERFMIHEPSRQGIQRLITTDRSLRTHKVTDDRAYAFLPDDLGFLVNDRSAILEDCKDEFKNPTEAVNYLVTALPFIDSPLSSGPFYSIIASRSRGGFSESKSRSFKLSHIAEKFELIDAVKDLLTIGNATVYWESFASIYLPEHFIVVDELPQEGGAYTYDLIVDNQPVTKVNRTISVTRYKAYTGRQVSNRSYKNDMVFDLMRNYYERPTPDSPVTYLANDNLFVISSERFLVPHLIIDYIRKPRRISVSLSQGPELDGSLHQTLCNLAAEKLLGEIEATNYPTKVQDNIRKD